MFCCTRKESHYGQLVTSICLQPECSQQSQQLSCCLCLSQHHKNHQVTSLKQHLPTLLSISLEKQNLVERLHAILKLILPEYYESNPEGIEVTLEKTLEKVRNQFQQNKEDSLRIRKALKQVQQVSGSNSSKVNQIRNFGKSNMHSSPQNRIQNERNYQSVVSPQKQRQFGSHLPYDSPAKSSFPMSSIHLATSGIHTQWGFSQKSKHSHISLSKGSKCATKTTNNPSKVIVVSSHPLTPEQPYFQLKIDQSQGNLMIGFCYQNKVLEKQLMNCYGMSSGTFLLGQNCNSSETSICFHSSNSTFNRKQIAGWNYFKDDTVILGGNFEEGYLFFKNKNTDQEFVMPLEELARLETPLKLLVLLQNEGDQVTLVQ